MKNDMKAHVPGRVAEVLRRSTVTIRSSVHSGGSGSGVVLTGGKVVTNAHVVQGGGSITVESWEGERFEAKIINSDRTRDLALLIAAGLDCPPIQFGDSDQVRTGAPVIAIGNPLGFTGAVSCGVIHASVPAVRSMRRPIPAQRWICADVRLAPGNSGGPLANLHGQVIGINTMLISSGLALAVPSRAVEGFIGRRTDRRALGVTLHLVALPNREAGMLILELEPCGPAEQASLLPGDILVSANGRVLNFIDDLQAALDDSQRSLLKVDFRRGGETRLRHVAIQLSGKRVTAAA